MYALFVIAKNNLKNKKGDAAVLVLLIALSALLIYTSVSILAELTDVLNTAYDNAHSADYTYVTKSDNLDKFRQIFLSDDAVCEYDVSKGIISTMEYRKSIDDKKSNYSIGIYAADEKRSIGKIPDKYRTGLKEGYVLLPYYLKSSFKQGETFYLTVDKKEYKFIVGGYIEDPIFAVPLNVPIYNIYIKKAAIMEMIKDNPELGKSIVYQHKARLREGTEQTLFGERIEEMILKEISDASEKYIYGFTWESMRGGDGIMSYMSMSLVLIFSVLLIFVVIIIVRFSIRNFIEKNMKNIGIMQAAGYTVRQLRGTTLFEMGIIALFGASFGVIAGLMGNKVIGSIEAMLLGISWNQGINIPVAVMTLFIIIFVVSGVTWISNRVYGKITVLDALRGGIHTHNFRKNVCPVSKSRMPLCIILSCKEIFGEKRKNLSVLFITVILSMTTCIGFAIYENFAVNTEELLKMVGIEIGNLYITGDNIEAAGREIESWDEIDKVLYYREATLKLINGDIENSVNCDSWENPNLLVNEMLVEGRLPKYENEIVITSSVAEKIDAETGDVIYVETGAGRKDFIVSGIDQKINHMGLKTLMNTAGLKRVNGEADIKRLVVYTKSGVRYKDIKNKLENKFTGIETANSKKEVSTTISSIRAAMAGVCTVFVLVTCFVVILVESLLINSKIVKEYKNYGISKAVGYTTGQLMLQTAMTNIPIILAGTLIGASVSEVVGRILALVCFSMFGFRKIDLEVDFVWRAVTAAGIVIAAVLASYVSSMRIRKIEPVEMLRE